MIKKISCGVVVYSEFSDLKRLVPHLQKELGSIGVEWIFVLNHEQKEIRIEINNWITENLPAAICIENAANNLGFARQLILENATEDYVYMTDPDIEILSGSLIQLVQMAEATMDYQFKNIGLGGALVYRSNLPILQSTFDLISKVAKAIPFSFQIQYHSRLTTVDHIPSCHILLKRQLALKIGGFSHLFSKVGEDLEFSHRAFNEGFCFIFIPSSKAIHYQNLTLGKWLSKIYRFGQVQITVQKMHFKKGLRYYRLLPLFLLLAFAAFAWNFSSFTFLCLSAFFIVGLIQKQWIGFFITGLAYSFGGLIELIYPTLGLENEAELQELRPVRSDEFLKTKS